MMAVGPDDVCGGVASPCAAGSAGVGGCGGGGGGSIGGGGEIAAENEAADCSDERRARCCNVTLDWRRESEETMAKIGPMMSGWHSPLRRHD